MKELQISIDLLYNEKQDWENKITDFSRYGRSPNDSDYFAMIKFLDNWRKIMIQISCLEELQKTFQINAS